MATTTPTFSGSAEAHGTVTVRGEGTRIGTTSANASGAWSLTPATALAQGAHSAQATAMDAAGNTSALSEPGAPLGAWLVNPGAGLPISRYIP